MDLTYVRSHQDDKKAYERLPLLAQLNVDADRLAGDYNRNHGAHRPFSIMTPSAGALLLTDEGTLTSAFPSELRIRSTGPPLERYIRSKNQWEQWTFDAINWEAHGKAVKASLPKRIQLTKFLHEAVPTHHQANLMDGGTRKCVACGICDETTDHILRCSAPSREAWRAQWWEAVEAFHEAFATHPLLRHLFREAMRQWFAADASDTVSPVLFPTEVRQLIQSQNAIGWRQILRGRFSLEWQRIQNVYYMQHRKKISFKRTGDRWQKQLIIVIWEAWFRLWTLRNGEPNDGKLNGS